MIRARGAEVADEFLEIVLGFGEAAAEFIEQFGIGGRVGNADVIDLVHDAHAEEMRPDDVREVAGEEGILGRGQPLGEALAAVRAGFQRRPSAAEIFREHVAVADGMVHAAAGAIEHDGFALVLAGLATDLGEEGGEAVVVVHGPAIEGMVVTLGALDAHAHENLGDVFGHFQHVSLDLVEVRGGIGEGAAGGHEQLLHELIDGDVLREFVLEPTVVLEGGLVLEGVVVGADLEQLSPFHHPDFRELRALEQFVDFLVALLWIGAGEEGAGLFGGGQ